MWFKNSQNYICIVICIVSYLAVNNDREGRDCPISRETVHAITICSVHSFKSQRFPHQITLQEKQTFVTTVSPA